MGIYSGTGEPVFFKPIELRFENAESLKATYQLVPIHELKGRYSPINMSWDLQLRPTPEKSRWNRLIHG